MAGVQLLTRITQMAHGVIASLRVRSSLNPMLWMGATFGLICFGFAYLFRFDPFIMRTLIVAGLVPMAVACFAAVFFTLFHPERLGSEDYQVRSHALRLIEEKGKRFDVDATSLQEIANPPPPKMLDDQREGE